MTRYAIYDDEGNETGTIGGRLFTCKTPGCENAGIAIEMPDNGNVKICGPCSNEIAPGDVVPD